MISNGIRSGLEEKVADLMVELDVKYEYESTKIPYQIQFNYTPDFLLPNGVYLECKRYWETEDRRKVKAVKQQHPDIDLRMVFRHYITRLVRRVRLLTHNGAISIIYHGQVFMTYHSDGSSEFLRHDPCTTCGSSDGLAVYDDGHTFFFRMSRMDSR